MLVVAVQDAVYMSSASAIFNITLVGSVDYGTIASPTRQLTMLMLTPKQTADSLMPIQNNYVDVRFNTTPSAASAVVNVIHNTHSGLVTSTKVASTAVDSGTTITTDLGSAPGANNAIYSAFVRVGGSSPTLGTGNTSISNYQVSTPLITTSVSTGRQTNTLNWTTSTQAAAISVELVPLANPSSGASGYNGRILKFEV